MPGAHRNYAIPAQVAELAEQVQAVTGESVEVAFIDQGYTGETAAEAAEDIFKESPQR